MTQAVRSHGPYRQYINRLRKAHSATTDKKPAKGNDNRKRIYIKKLAAPVIILIQSEFQQGIIPRIGRHGNFKSPRPATGALWSYLLLQEGRKATGNHSLLTISQAYNHKFNPGINHLLITSAFGTAIAVCVPPRKVAFSYEKQVTRLLYHTALKI